MVTYLSIFLHDQGDSVDKLGSWDVLMVHQIVVLGHLPGSPDEEPVVRPHAAVDHSDVAGDLLDLVGGVVLKQDGLVLLLRGQNYAIHCLDTNTGCSTGNCL